LLDSVSIDDFSGGASAAQLLAAQTNTTNKKSSNQFVVLTGPADDARSNERRDGFLSVCQVQRLWCRRVGFLKMAFK
jgi:DNA-binding LacI/PurR family transcriptional regulator